MSFVSRSIHRQSDNRSMVDLLVGSLAGSLEISLDLSSDLSSGIWLEQPVQGSNGARAPALKSQA